jgi:hypothetical protein
MTPDVGTVLNGIARSLMFDIAPEVQSAYAGQTVQLTAGLLMMINEEFDRAAARLVEENGELLRLFAAAAAVVGAAELGGTLRSEAERGAGGTLQVSALRERNRTLRGLLVRLHEHVETLDGAGAREVEERIWSELAASTRRRQVSLANG